MTETFLDGRVTLHCGDCLDVLRTLPDNSVDSMPTDPPYALVSIVKRFGADGAAPVIVPERGSGAYARASAGFMGKRWDTGKVAHSVEFWAECLRVLKPGGHLAAFAGSRTYHRMACAIEDAGFEIRDMIAWTYGSGFPKSHDVAKGLRRELAGPDLIEQWNGWGTAIKPAFEPICLARKPLSEGNVAANVIRWGTGALNIDGCRIHGDDSEGYEYTAARTMPGAGQNATGERKQVGVTYTGRTKDGRWPANLVHDGSPEVLALFPESNGGHWSGETPSLTGKQRLTSIEDWDTATGSAARFFYQSKADADDRIGSRHPTVKPVDLMQWLIRLITPKGGTSLDPFAGTGTTGEAAFREGMRCILIERETTYQDDIRRRMRLVLSGPEERSRESIKAKIGEVPFEEGSLFAALNNG